MADLEISIGINAKDTKKGADEAKSALKGVGDEAEKAGKKAKSAADRDVSSLSAALGELKKLGPAIAAGLSAIGAAAIAAGVALYNLTRQAAAYGATIKDAADRTGLSATTISGLKFAADRAGSSFEEITSAVAKFSAKLGEANGGNEKALQSFQKYGIAARDVDGALREAIKAINDMGTADQRAAAAKELFGDEAGKLIPVILQMNGSIDEAIKKADELGLVLDDRAAASAKRLDSTMKDLGDQLRGAALQIGMELIPTLTVLSGTLSEMTKDANSQIPKMGRSVNDTLMGIIEAIRRLDGVSRITTQSSLASWILWAERMYMVINPIYYLALRLGQALRSIAPGRADMSGSIAPSLTQSVGGGPRATGGVLDPSLIVSGIGGGGGRRGGGGGGSRGMSEEQRQLERMQDLVRDLNLEIQFFGDRSREAAVKQQLLRAGVADLNSGLALQATGLARNIDQMEATAKAAEEAAKAQKKLQEDFGRERADITNQSFRTNVGLGMDKALLDEQIRLGRELSAVEEFRLRTTGERILLERAYQIDSRRFTKQQIAEFLSLVDVERERTAEILKQVQARRDQIEAEAAFRGLSGDLTDELRSLNIEMGNAAAVTREYQVEKLLLTEAYKNLTAVQKEQLLTTAREVDAAREAVKAQKEAQQAYDQIFQTVQRHLDVLANQGFGAFFKGVFGQFKQFLRDMVAEWLTSQFFKLFFKGGNNQTAQQNGQGGGIMGGILNGIFGRGAGGMGPGGTGTFSGSGGGGMFGGLGSIFGGGSGGAMGRHEMAHAGAGGGGGGIFGSGGLFGPRMNILSGKTSKLGGMMGGIGAIASVAGSAIGGRFGGILSAAGTGASIGAMFGPWGAAIGAGIGALFGLFGGDPKRKRDKNEKLPELNRGFTDSLQQLRDLIRDVRTLRVDPDSAISRAQELRTQIASGFGIQFESKKYRKQAQTLVRQRTAEADALLEELRRVAEISRAAGERERRIIPEFASGVYMSPAFMRQLAEQRRQMNGMIPGRFRGQDNIPAMISPGEMVLNPMQQQRVRAAAGFDPFRSAGIPGYSNAGGGGQGGQGVALTLQFEHSIDSEGMVKTTLKNSSAVQQQLQLTIEDLSANDRLTQRRRGV